MNVSIQQGIAQPDLW